MFVCLLRQVQRQPVQHIFMDFNFKWYKKELNARWVRYRSGCHSTCGSVVVLTAAYSVLKAASLISPLLHSELRASTTPLRCGSNSFQQLLAHQLPVFGSPAGRCGLRLNCFICLHFALAIKAVALCSSFHSEVFVLKNYKNPTFHFAHSCKSFS